MKASKMMLATLKEAPQEAQISSHILLIRAGMIRKLVAGVYSYLPLGLRTLRKIETIIREEMDESGAQEILSSAIQPKELWEESGRWQKYGPELMRFKDRHEREFCLGPTHEEFFVLAALSKVKSYLIVLEDFTMSNSYTHSEEVFYVDISNVSMIAYTGNIYKKIYQYTNPGEDWTDPEILEVIFTRMGTLEMPEAGKNAFAYGDIADLPENFTAYR